MSFLDLIARLRNNAPAPGDCPLAAAHLARLDADLSLSRQEVEKMRRATELIEVDLSAGDLPPKTRVALALHRVRAALSSVPSGETKG